MPPYGSITAFECRYDPNGLQQPVSDRGQGCVGAPNPALIIIGREDIRYCQMHSVEFFFLERNTACYIHQGLQRLHVYIFSASQGGQPIPVDEVWKHTLPKDLCKELGIPEPELISAPLLRQNPLVIPSSVRRSLDLFNFDIHCEDSGGFFKSVKRVSSTRPRLHVPRRNWRITRAANDLRHSVPTMTNEPSPQERRERYRNHRRKLSQLLTRSTHVPRRAQTRKREDFGGTAVIGLDYERRKERRDIYP
ncbi:hypothetical protein BD410DRAFT_844073 [Rickenella mellea]|uniref:Uncharacterized protein n=1 Tax=Rickenella mellea TaxID=50990 RepID=A0A4Y7PPE4_9AGAM|nr:hypothetical protein BD410DRAFT_844073 [Rickenella mellea]